MCSTFLNPEPVGTKPVEPWNPGTLTIDPNRPVPASDLQNLPAVADLRSQRASPFPPSATALAVAAVVAIAVEQRVIGPHGAVARFRVELGVEQARQRHHDAAVAGRDVPVVGH